MLEYKTLPVLGLLEFDRGFKIGLERRVKPKNFRMINQDFEKRLKLRERFENYKRSRIRTIRHIPVPYAMLTGPFWPNVLKGKILRRAARRSKRGPRCWIEGWCGYRCDADDARGAWTNVGSAGDERRTAKGNPEETGRLHWHKIR